MGSTDYQHFVNPRSLPPGAQLLPPGRDYRKDDSYVDNITGGGLDLVSGAFWVHHKDGTTVYLDYVDLWRDFNPDAYSFGIVTPGTQVQSSLQWRYVRASNGKIYPSKFNRQTSPNIEWVCRDIEARKGDRIETLVALQLVIAVYGVAGGAAASAQGTGNRNIVRERARKVGSLGHRRIPQLQPDNPGAMVREAVRHVDEYPGTPSEKAAMMEHLLEQIRVRNTEWGFVHQVGADGSQIFFGTAGGPKLGPHVMVIGADGKMHKAIMRPGLFSRTNANAPLQPNYVEFGRKVGNTVTDLKK